MVLSLYYTHWDKPGGEAHYTVRMLKGGLSVKNLVENTHTIFVQRNRSTNKIERCWEGTVHDFKFEKDEKGRDAVRFRYSLEKEIPCPPVYAAFPVGWHLIEEPTTPQGKFNPPFVHDLIATNDWQTFEKYVSWLLKLLGIHNLYTFDERNQPGRPDGFFKLGRSAVIYDVTLSGDFISAKKEQINNYCSQLKTGVLEYAEGTVDVRGCEKQVWIITRGKTHALRKIDDIAVKEISVQELLNLNEKRIVNNLDEDQLAYELKNLGR